MAKKRRKGAAYHDVNRHMAVSQLAGAEIEDALKALLGMVLSKDVITEEEFGIIDKWVRPAMPTPSTEKAILQSVMLWSVNCGALTEADWRGSLECDPESPEAKDGRPNEFICRALALIAFGLLLGEAIGGIPPEKLREIAETMPNN